MFFFPYNFVQFRLKTYITSNSYYKMHKMVITISVSVFSNINTMTKFTKSNKTSALLKAEGGVLDR